VAVVECWGVRRRLVLHDRYAAEDAMPPDGLVRMQLIFYRIGRGGEMFYLSGRQLTHEDRRVVDKRTTAMNLLATLSATGMDRASQ